MHLQALVLLRTPRFLNPLAMVHGAQEYYLMTLCQPTDHAASPSSSTTCSGSEGFESGAPARRAHSLATGLLTRVRVGEAADSLLWSIAG